MPAAAPQSIQLQENAPMPMGAYAHAKVIPTVDGTWVYLCGMGARDPKTGKEAGVNWSEDGSEVLTYDIEIQTRQVLTNMASVLEACGCTMEHLVDVSVFLRYMKDFDRYNKVYGDYFKSLVSLPARTTIEGRPPGYNFIEIKGIAFKPAP